MAARFWVGGSGTWNAVSTANWSASSGGVSGASVPTSTDTVTFDTASNATAYTVTLGGAAGSDITFGNPASGVITIAGSGGNVDIYGSLSVAAGALWTSTRNIFFRSTVTGNTITTNSVTINGQINFNGVGGGWTLQDNVTFPFGVVLTAGALDTNSKTLTINNNFNISGATTRTLTLGSSTITGVAWTATTTTNLTFNAGTSTITNNNSGSMNFGTGLTYYNVVFSDSGLGVIFSGSATFNNLTVIIPFSAAASYVFNGDHTVNGLLTLTGVDSSNLLTLKSDIGGVTRTITPASYSISNVTLTDVVIVGYPLVSSKGFFALM